MLQKMELPEVLALRRRVAELELKLAHYQSRSGQLPLLQSAADAPAEGVVEAGATGTAADANQAASDLPGIEDLTVKPLLAGDQQLLATLAVLPAGPGGNSAAGVGPDNLALGETIPQIVFSASPDGAIEFVNQWATVYTGLTALAFHGMGWRQIVHPDDLRAFADSDRKPFEVGEIFEGECRIADAGGKFRWFLTRSIPVRDSAGTILKWIGTCTDINDQKNAADLAQKQQKWLRTIFDMMPVGVVFLELGTARITFANRFVHALAGGEFAFAQNPGECEAIYKWRDEEGNPLMASGYPTVRAAAGECLEGMRLKWDTSKGLREVLCHSHNLPEMYGQPSTGILVFQDVSLLIQAETELQQKQADLIRSNEDLQQFAYAASHDLQEPLRMVSGFIQLLSRRYAGKLDAEADEYIQFAVEGSNRMGQLIRDLLLFSRLGNPETRRLELVDMTSAVHWALLNLQTAVKESAAVVTLDPLPSVTGDQSRLALVMQNLIGNAIKYRTADPPAIHISVVREGGNWVFCVADNGVGFEIKYAERIFGLFKRLHGKEIPGTGIGLSIAKKVVEIHNGRIWADSVPGKGSSFYFTLPVEEV